ncbi:hypothetical protein RFI_09605 [Reticulomyxa filosa]|uniref:Uncharacterized protein n=1 Tax=Reticulomyxa filosa TaxID=46433 RepID=X6NPB0_RETFI|nr:hypothetical protein RFI_09605 [Reticulomyxa filosa]|eukprot:ETO27524.1 hypothetical protein RFI_09605 [Reticulomyxa filosa]
MTSLSDMYPYNWAENFGLDDVAEVDDQFTNWYADITIPNYEPQHNTMGREMETEDTEDYFHKWNQELSSSSGTDSISGRQSSNENLGFGFDEQMNAEQGLNMCDMPFKTSLDQLRSPRGDCHAEDVPGLNKTSTNQYLSFGSASMLMSMSMSDHNWWLQNHKDNENCGEDTAMFPKGHATESRKRNFSTLKREEEEETMRSSDQSCETVQPMEFPLVNTNLIAEDVFAINSAEASQQHEADPAMTNKSNLLTSNVVEKSIGIKKPCFDNWEVWCT